MTQFTRVVNGSTELTASLFNDLQEAIEQQSFNALRYGAVGDGSTDDTEALQATIDAAAAVEGIAFLPAGTYVISETLYIPTKTTLMGVGIGSVIQATNGTFDGTVMVELGAVADTVPHSVRLERLVLDAYAKTGLQPVYSSKIQENSGLFQVVLSSYMNVFAASFASVAENFTLQDVYCVPHPSSTGGGGVYLEVVPWMTIRRLTVHAPNGSTSSAVELNDSHALLQDIHCEDLAQGVLVYNQSTVTAMDIHGIDVTELVEIAENAGANNVLINILEGSGVTTIVEDGINTQSIATDVALYVTGSFYHDGVAL